MLINVIFSSLLGCSASPKVSTAQDTSKDSATTPIPMPSTAEQLESFYTQHGGRNAFPPHQVDALEALLYGQDDLQAGDWSSAQQRVNAIFETMPLYDSIWTTDLGYDGINIGTPVAYYGLRMLEQILSLGEQPETGTLTMTAVVAPCATVTRPTLPDLEPETVELDIAPEILVNDARVLELSTQLFRRWVEAITGGLKVDLRVFEMTECTTVDYTDDGAIVLSYPDSYGMIESVPSEIARDTDFWWVVAPSGVPGDGSGYNRHFITGGMGGYGAGRPLFLSDDAWFTRKVEHLGSGPYSEVELRAYQPQWFQHEFMHHLYRTWPEYGLEDTGHQWFDLSTWPSDFVGIWEPDYYYESITKRLLQATPPMAEELAAPNYLSMSTLSEDLLLGSYQRQPVLNAWHNVAVVLENNQLWWQNEAGVRWQLEIRDDQLWAGPDCPYGEQELLVGGEGTTVTGLWFGGEEYKRLDD